MKNTTEERGNGKRPTAATASARRAKTVEHPPKPKCTCKRQDQPETEHPETEHQADPKALDEPDVPDDLLDDKELLKGEENAGLTQCEPFRNSFEGQPEPDVFSGSRQIKRWHGKTNNYYMSNGEMTITLDDVRCLLHLLIEGGPLDHRGILTKDEGVELMIEYIGASAPDADCEVTCTKEANAWFTYLKRLI
ncbi:putative IMP dehydrogenase/GMP reductase [Trifolium medium]|uniref:Putative IMP dehydrogenase/GMP reductase n=1 Tax=Trifolium medium TaxID=97028 RepID=A0A392MUP4_9FABA|nr:putative IMP dehydrogenase/GMP reductase [Trifolium medium]